MERGQDERKKEKSTKKVSKDSENKDLMNFKKDLMLTYLFLLAAATTAPELPTIHLTQAETTAIEEIVAVLEQKENTLAIITETPESTATAAVAVEAQSITITNAIEQSMLEYNHWTGKYSPEQFAISINGVEIELGKTYEIPAQTKTVEIGYTYSFMNGIKSGGRKISYQLDENISHANITFNWKDNWRVLIDNGKAVKEVI
jgi:hypothetical protein